MTGKYRKMTAKTSGKSDALVRKAVRLATEALCVGGFDIAEGGHGPGSFVYPKPGDDRYIQVVYVPAGMRFSQDAAGEWNMRPDAPGNWRRHPTIEGGWMYCDENGEPIDVPEDVAAHLRSLSDGWGHTFPGPRPEAIQ